MVDGLISVEQLLEAGFVYYRDLGVAQDASMHEILQA